MNTKKALPVKIKTFQKQNLADEKSKQRRRAQPFGQPPPDSGDRKAYLLNNMPGGTELGSSEHQGLSQCLYNGFFIISGSTCVLLFIDSVHLIMGGKDGQPWLKVRSVCCQPDCSFLFEVASTCRVALRQSTHIIAAPVSSLADSRLLHATASA